jgi:uncharacterized membrane protein
LKSWVAQMRVTSVNTWFESMRLHQGFSFAGGEDLGYFAY